MITDDMIHGGFALQANRIDEDTPLVPRAIAEGVSEEVSVWLRQALAPRWVRELVVHANTVYACIARFRRKVLGRGNVGQDGLWMFMRHWLAALLKARRPQMYARLPASFATVAGLPLQARNSRIVG
jgi:hypothetical protein